MPSPLRGMRQTSPPWHIAMPSGGGIHSIIASLADDVCGEAPWRTTARTALSRELNLVARRLEVRAQVQAAVGSAPRSERFLSEDAERAAEMRWRWTLRVFGLRREWRRSVALIRAI